MKDIDAILDLARALEPGTKVNPEFSLHCTTEGKWTARVCSTKYFLDATDKDSPEEAIECLREDLESFNKNLLRRVTESLKRWTTNVTGGLRVVK